METGGLSLEMYRRIFGKDVEFRKKMYQALCAKLFHKYTPMDSTVLGFGAGYCEFINNIRAKRKIAFYLNRDIKKFAKDLVEVVIASSMNQREIENGSVDAAFANNLFGHLTKEDGHITFGEVERVLKKEGSLLILQQKIRFCFSDYWMFFDHITPLKDRNLSIFLIEPYLKFPLAHRILGTQVFFFVRERR